MNKGIGKLNENWEDLHKTLKKGDKTSQDYAEALVETEKAMRNILNLSDDAIIPEGFLEVPENLELLDAISDGSEEAVQKLGFNLAKAQIEAQDFTSKISENLNTFFKANEGDDSLELFEQIKTNALNTVNEIQAAFSGVNLGEGIGSEAQQKQWAEALNQYAMATGMTAEQMNSFLGSVGVTAHVEMIEGEPVTKKIPVTKISRKRIKNNIFTGEQEWEEDAQVVKYKEVTEPTLIPQIDMTPKGQEPSKNNPIFTKTNMGNISPSATKGKSSSGPGSSKKSSGSKKEKKEKRDERDYPYHEEERQLAKLERQMKKTTEAKNRAYGEKYIKNLNKEIELLDKEIEQYEEIEKVAKKQIQTDKNVLKNKYKIKFGKDDEITNYEEVFEQEYAKYQEAYNNYEKKRKLYNQGKIKENELKKAETKLTNASDDLDEFKKLTGNYEKSLDKRNEALDAQLEKEREKLDKQLEGIQYKVDINLEINNEELKRLERLLDRLEDASDGAEKIKNLSSQADQQFTNYHTGEQGIKDVLKNAGASDDQITDYLANKNPESLKGLKLESGEMEKLTKYTGIMNDAADSLLNLQDMVAEQVINTFDALHEKIEDNAAAFEHATSMVKSYKNMIDLVGQDALGIDDAFLTELESVSVDAAKNTMANAQAQLEYTKSALADAKTHLENAATEEDKKMWQDTIDHLNEQLREDEQGFMDAWNDALQAAADAFEAQMERNFKKLEDNLAGVHKSFDELQKSMEKTASVSDRYLDSGKKLYELSKMNRKLQQDLDKTDSTKGQKILLKMQEEINAYQAAGVKMSQRDLEALQKKYDLKLAEIALEESQNAKSQVRLQKDSQGNFGYVYTADDTSVANAQQTYEDKLEENRQLAISQSEELTNSIVANRQAMVEALQEIRRQDYESDAAYYAAMEETTKFYTEQEAYLIEESNKVIQRSNEIYTEDYQNYTQWASNKKTTGESLVEAFGSVGGEDTKASGIYGTLGQNASGWLSHESQVLIDLGATFSNAVGKDGCITAGTTELAKHLGTFDGKEGFFKDTYDATSTWSENIDKVMKQAGINIGDGLTGKDGAAKQLENFKKKVKENLYGEGGTKDKPTSNSVVGAMDAASNKITSIKDNAIDLFTKTTTQAEEWQKKWTKNIDAVKTSADKAAQALQALKKEMAGDLLTTTTQASSSTTTKAATSTTKPTTKPTTATTKPAATTKKNFNGNNKVDVGEKVRLKDNAKLAASSSDTPSISTSYAGKVVWVQTKVDSGNARIHVGTSADFSDKNSWIGWVNKAQLVDSSYDTGGYTGKWGPEGKMAMLHQKEIVLNAHDTENFLTAINIVREISNRLEANAKTMSQLQNLERHMFNLGLNENRGIQQDITIHADFPNATNHSEIEEAFKNLSNLASQYVNRKN